jgi:hypothetical protein
MNNIADELDDELRTVTDEFSVSAPVEDDSPMTVAEAHDELRAYDEAIGYVSVWHHQTSYSRNETPGNSYTVFVARDSRSPMQQVSGHNLRNVVETAKGKWQGRAMSCGACGVGL